MFRFHSRMGLRSPSARGWTCGVGLVCAALIVLLPAGCGDTFPASIAQPAQNAAMTAAAFSPLMPIVGIGSSIQYYQKIADAAQRLPYVSVRIVNETDVEASVTITPGLRSPDPGPLDDVFPYNFLFGFAFQQYVTLPEPAQAVFIKPRGTVTGKVRCGDIQGVSALVPSTAATYYGYSYSYYDPGYNGFYASAGNIQFDGAGASSPTDALFTGDLATPPSAVRYLLPADHGLDCATGTLVIHLKEPGVDAIINPSTGQIATPAALGLGTLSIE